MRTRFPPWAKNWGSRLVADTIRAVKGLLYLLMVPASCLAFAQPVWAADDAYDDEEEERGPRAHEQDEADQGEVTEGGLKTGGMTAPKALGETGDKRSEIEKELEESDERDSGRGLEFFWLTADVGFQSLSLDALGDEGLLASGAASSASGLSLGGGAGVRILYFSLGARFRYGDLSEFTHWSLLGEAALRVPLGKFEPYGLLGIGYGAVTGISGADNVGGVDLRLGGGLDYYFSDSFSAGAQASGDLLFLSGSAGSATGAGMSGMALVGLHF